MRARRVVTKVSMVAVASLLLGLVSSTATNAAAPAKPPGCANRSTVTAPSVEVVPIPDLTTVTSDIVVASPGFVEDLDVTVNIPHTFPADLDITLTSPSGTVVKLTTDNGGSADNVFAGTTFDDQADPANPVPYDTLLVNLASDASYSDFFPKPTLAPEGGFGAMWGQQVAGTWRLSVTDDAGGDIGSLNGWSMTMKTFGEAPQILTSPTVSNVVAGAISNATVLERTFVIPPGYSAVQDVALDLGLTHAAVPDLDISLTSPGGRVATVLTDPGGPAPAAFANLQFTSAASDVVSDAPNGSGTTTWRPEEGFAVFADSAGSGTWTLRIADDTPAVDGTFNTASLTVKAASCPPLPAPPLAPSLCGSPTTSTVMTSNPDVVVPTGPATVAQTLEIPPTTGRILDVDVLVDVPHTFSADLDMTVISPTGTRVPLTFDNGGGLDDVFAPARFDDDADPDGALLYGGNDGVVTDTVFRNKLPIGRSAPQRALGQLYGQDPSGTWTLEVVDDLGGDGGTIRDFGLVLTTTPRAVAKTVTANKSPAPALVIPDDGAAVSHSTNVAGTTFPVTDVRVTVNIPHTFTSDLDLTLRSPAGTIVTLATDDAGENDNAFAGAVFRDDAAAGAANATYVNLVPIGDVAPEEPLSAFDGESANGSWTLSASDDTPLETGTITSWSLAVDTGRCNRPASVANDAYTVPETVVTAVPAGAGLLANDSDADGDPMAAAVVAQPTHGDVVLAADGSFTYTPDRRYLGPDSFTYRVNDGIANSSTRTVTLTVDPPTCAPLGPFTDVPEAQPFCNPILWMANDGITAGFPDGTFQPGAAVTRQSMAAFLFRTLNPGSPPPPACLTQPFNDVPKTHPFCSYIKWMADVGVGGGFADGTFKPAASVTRQAMAAFLYRAENGLGSPPACTIAPFTDVPADNPFCPQIKWMAEEQIAGGFGDGSFKPTSAVSRQAMASFLQKYVHRPV